jgi:hypothetical protein
MKKSALIIAAGALLLTGFNACGPGREEQQRLQRIEDSLNALDRDHSVDEANRLLQQADSTEKAMDSLAMEGAGGK